MPWGSRVRTENRSLHYGTRNTEHASRIASTPRLVLSSCMAPHWVILRLEDVSLGGDFNVHQNALDLVLFAHGSGSGRYSPRNQFVARVLREMGIGTLLFDLLTDEEEQADARTRQLRFDIPFLARRLTGATRWVLNEPTARDLNLGYFGASTGAAAAL